MITDNLSQLFDFITLQRDFIKTTDSKLYIVSNDEYIFDSKKKKKI